nr:DNA glycosylase [Candidatus Nitrosopumilus sediminis]
MDSSINSGQVFLWKKNNANWYGVNGQDILKITNSGDIKSYQNDKTDFFRKKDNIEKIIKSISKDDVTKKAIKQYPGLRVFEQDPFQCLISFIVSSNSNIQKIKNSLEKMSKRFGIKTEFDDQEFFLFPKPEKLAKASINEIKSCGVGYRANFIKEAANRTALKKIDFEYLKKCSYQEAKKEICQIPGVGNKVADCIMLFSLNKLESFPLDRWMIRILEKYYSDKFQLETKTITEKQYGILHEKIVNHFGPFAGYAQQFLFKMERENYQKKWL